jgi:hypothetical protein
MPDDLRIPDMIKRFTDRRETADEFLVGYFISSFQQKFGDTLIGPYVIPAEEEQVRFHRCWDVGC